MTRPNLRSFEFLLLTTIMAVAGQVARAESPEKKEKSAPPAIGDQAPDFELAAIDGKKTTLASLTDKGPVVLVILRGYPGYQCPVCNKQVSQFLARADAFRDAKANVVLVYPGPAQELKKRGEEFVRGKTFPNHFHFLLDPDYELTNAYHLRWEAPMETAYPSTFLVDSQRKVRFAKVSKTHGGRASPDEVLKALEKP